MKLKANTSHPTHKKLQRLIGFLHNAKLNIEWVDGVLKVSDYELNVAFDLLDKHNNAPMSELPPLFDHKLVRDKCKNSLCKCSYCSGRVNRGKR